MPPKRSTTSRRPLTLSNPALFFHRLTLLPRPILKRIASYFVQSDKATILALRQHDNSSQLQAQRWSCFDAVQRPITLLHAAEKVFFEENVVFVESLDLIRQGITRRWMDDVQKLWVNYEPDMSSTYGDNAVNAAYGAISTALTDLPAMKILYLAITYSSWPERKAELDGEAVCHELWTVVEACGMLDVRCFVCVCSEEAHVERKKRLEIGEVEEGEILPHVLAESEGGVFYEV